MSLLENVRATRAKQKALVASLPDNVLRDAVSYYVDCYAAVDDATTDDEAAAIIAGVLRRHEDDPAYDAAFHALRAALRAN